MHSTTPILPSYNYYGNPTHKVNECNIPFKDLLLLLLWVRGTLGSYLFCQVPRTKATPINMTKFASIFCCLSPKTKAPQPSTQAFPTKGNSNKNVKKSEQNVDKREVLEAHVVQVQSMQNELESLRAQFANLKNKSS